MSTVLARAPILVSRTGRTITLAVDRWLADVDADEESVLDRARGPVLDVGCGPGRHVVALGRRGVMALGVDVAPSAVVTARRRGGLILQRSVFERLPGVGRWGSALLLDGNVGIGGDPPALLRRLAALVRHGGRVLVEVEPPGTPASVEDWRVESGSQAGPWFPWAVVGVEDVDLVASASGLRAVERWSVGRRWFAQLERP
jgi:SAM-dependent methyltransferase